jgi:hypothetical protein
MFYSFPQTVGQVEPSQDARARATAEGNTRPEDLIPIYRKRTHIDPSDEETDKMRAISLLTASRHWQNSVQMRGIAWCALWQPVKPGNSGRASGVSLDSCSIMVRCCVVCLPLPIRPKLSRNEQQPICQRGACAGQATI